MEEDTTDHMGPGGAGAPGRPTAAGWKAQPRVTGVTSVESCHGGPPTGVGEGEVAGRVS